MTLYREESYVKISWDEKAGIVWVEWKNQAIGEELKAGMKFTLQLLKKKHAQNLVLNFEMVGLIDLENQKWIAKEWLPNAMTSGLKHIAYLMPVSLLVRLSVKNAIEMLDTKELESACFDTSEAARKWFLRTQE